MVYNNIAVNEAAPLVKQAAQEKVAVNNPVQATQSAAASDGSENFFEGGNKAMGRFENANITNGDTATTTGNATSAKSSDDNGESLSSALQRSNANSSTQSKPEFHKDPNKKDGGFFGWLKGVLPKNRNGKKEGESDDAYDRRITRNKQMVATFADAIRHIGNIVNTSQGAPLQAFNDPNAILEKGYEKRKKERSAQAAAAADAEYKNAGLKLKERAAAADLAYKQYLANMSKNKFDYQKEKDKAAAERAAANDKQKQDNWTADFEEKKRHNKVQEGISASKGKGKGGSSGKSGGKYRVYNKNTGQYEWFQNQGSRDQRAAELGYDLTPGSTSSTSSETVTAKGVTKTTTRQGRASVSASLGRQEAAVKAANAARKKAAQQNKAQKPAASSSGKKGKSGKSYTRTKGLGL